MRMDVTCSRGKFFLQQLRLENVTSGEACARWDTFSGDVQQKGNFLPSKKSTQTSYTHKKT